MKFRRGRPMIRTALLLLLLSAGCYYGNMQGAHTLGNDHMIFRGSMMFPAFFSAEDRREAEESGEDDPGMYPAFTFATGATSRLDVGISAYGYGAGPFVKAGVLDPSVPEALSVMAGVSYVVPVEVLATRAAVTAGRRFGPDFEVWAGYEFGYSPDLLNIPENTDGVNDWDAVDNTFFHGLKLGMQYEIANMDSWVPESVVIEFLVPLGLRWDIVFAGLGITY
jgi:hypothetical protein